MKLPPLSPVHVHRPCVLCAPCAVRAAPLCRRRAQRHCWLLAAQFG